MVDHMCIRPTPSRSVGLTLVELMVALVVSLILTAGIISIFIQSRTSYQVQESLTKARADGAAAISILEQEIRVAGYPQDALILESGIAGTGGATGASTHALASAPTVTWDAATTTDNAIIVQRRSPAAGHLNCAGEVFAANAFVSERFSVGTADGRTGLLCEGLADRVVLVEDVTGLTFTYGEDTDDDGVPNGYVPIANVVNLNNVVSVGVTVAVDVDYPGMPDLSLSTIVPLRNQIR